MRSARLIALAFVSYLIVAGLQAWPLPLHLGDRLTGEPGGDAGVYVWNTWVFRHELIERRTSPFKTETILPLDGPVDLSLHNYTVFSDLLALPLQPILGVVATFNLVYLINAALAGLGVFVLVRHVYGTSAGQGSDAAEGQGEPYRGGTAEAWLAGLLFACSPFLVARSVGHFSLAAAAPLPFFAVCFDRAWRHQRTRDGAAAGACLGWAAFSDPYYAIYCLLLAAFIAAAHVVRVDVQSARAPSRRARQLLDIGIVAGVAIIIVVRAFEGGSVQIGPVTVSMRSLYTPMLILTMLVVARVLLSVRARMRWLTLPRPVGVVRIVGTLGVVAALLMLPELYAIVVRAAEGRFVRAPVLWRSSAPGVDLASLVLPNPNHPLAPASIVEWVARQPGQYEENVASIPWVALLVLIAAWRWAGYRVPRVWLVMAVVFASLSLGPFLRIAGIETYVPTPWAILRYVPIVGEARMPARFGVLVILAVSVMFAGALAALCRLYPERRRVLLATAGLLLAFEVLPAPRTLYSAEIPALYHRIAADPRPVRVLELPFGVRDGLSSLGNFSASSQFFQTAHGKPLIGGYLSRVSAPRKAFYLSLPYVEALLAKSEGLRLTDAQRDAARRAIPDFVERARVGYVVIDTRRVTPELRQFAIETLGLTLVETSGVRELYVPASAAR